MKNHHLTTRSALKRIARRPWFWAILGLGVIAALVLLSMPIGIDISIERYFLAHGADYANVEDVDFNPFTRRLVLRNLLVKVEDKQVLKVPRADFAISWSPLFKKHFLIERINLSNSHITIEEQPDGRLRIGGFLPAASENRSSPSSWGFGLSELQAQNSTVILRSSQLNTELKIEQSRLTGLRSWMPDQNPRLEFKGHVNDGKLQFQGDFSPFGNATTVGGSVILTGLTLTPFAQLISADPSTLKGRLDADVRIQSKYSSEKGFTFDQRGRLTLNQARMHFGDVDIADEDLMWDGSVQIKMPNASDELHISATGQLGGNDGAVDSTPDKLVFRHGGLSWNGKFVLVEKAETSDYNFDGVFKLQKFNIAPPEMNLAEESLLWDGNVRITMPNSIDALLITAAGKMAGKRASLNLPSPNFKLQGIGLNWNGKFTFDSKKEVADTKLDGDLNFGKLEVTTSDVLLTEEDLSWKGGLQILLPENSAGQRLTTNGNLESRRQTMALLRENLSLANENLSWKGRFNCGLKDFTAGLAADGDFSLTDLAITATQKKLRLLAAKAVNLKSIKGDADTQFNVATANITGLDLVGETGSPKKASLFSASELKIDTVKFEGLKYLSIESARIVAAKGVLHHKKDGRWLYIDDLTTYLTGSDSSAQTKPSQNKAVEKAQTPAKEKDVESGIRIGSLEIVGDSMLHFEDETVSPAFSTDVVLKEARLTGVNSFQPEQSSPFTLEASSRKYTSLKLQGNVQPFRERISMDLKGKIKAAEMPPLSPYAVKTLGYNLISGEMDADIDLKIVVGKLEGEGDLKFYNPKIEAVDPEKFKNEKGKSIPLQSALDVLRDKDNDVSLKIPISGDVTDPEFSFSDAINQALIKGLTMATLSYLKYMLGPYGMAIGIIELGAKVGAKALPGIRLNPVDFQPGASNLDPATMEYLDKVVAILKGKKDLRLRLCGWATDSDRMGPREATVALPGAQSSEANTITGRQIAPTKDSRFPLSDEAMLALAKQRAEQIEDLLVGQHGIKDKRIFICKPEIDKNPDAKPRVELVF